MSSLHSKLIPLHVLRLKRALTITDIRQDITRFLCASKGLFTNLPSLRNVEDLAYEIVSPTYLKGLKVSAAVGFVGRLLYESFESSKR